LDRCVPGGGGPTKIGFQDRKAPQKKVLWGRPRSEGTIQKEVGVGRTEKNPRKRSMKLRSTTEKGDKKNVFKLGVRKKILGEKVFVGIQHLGERAN